MYYNLQEERRLSAERLAGQAGAAEALTRQRHSTDGAVATFLSLSDDSAVGDAPAEVRDAVADARQAIGKLSAQRSLVDDGDADQQEAVYRYYTDLISVDLKLFTALSHVDNGRITTASQPLVDLFWTKEMVSRSDALLARGWSRGRLSATDYQQVQQAVLDQSFLQNAKLTPYLPADLVAVWQKMTSGAAWQSKTRVEQTLLHPAAPDASGNVRLPADRQKPWRLAMDALKPQLEGVIEERTDQVVAEGKDSVLSLLRRLVLTSLIGLAAVVAVILTTWRLTRSLRLRIRRLQEQAEALEKALPEVVERLGRGEEIDVETEARAIRPQAEDGAADELTRLGQALNLARTSALQAAVNQADQHRGFERLLQRIARRTQQLIGQQLKKLDEMERRHEDSEVLDGLFDLDHLTARLRRYEENLVILSGGTPHRRWRKPVALLDVMRSAQGEVQDYQRVVLDLDGSPWLAARAVGPVSHVLAELIENALAFSRPPSPVEVRAATVSRGLAIEVEDRGLGMDEEQLAEANALMLRPPRLDILAHAEDIRLGLHVVARLAAQYGLGVEFRSSAYGGTRVVVLVPGELTVAEPAPRGPVGVPAPEPVPAAATATAGPQDPLPSRRQGQALAAVTPLVPHTAAAPAPGEPAEPAYAAPVRDDDAYAGAGTAHGRDDVYAGPGREAPYPGAGQPPTGPSDLFTPPDAPFPGATDHARHEIPAPLPAPEGGRVPYGRAAHLPAAPDAFGAHPHPGPDAGGYGDQSAYGNAQTYGDQGAYGDQGRYAGPAPYQQGANPYPVPEQPAHTTPPAPAAPAEEPGHPVRYVTPLPSHTGTSAPLPPAPGAEPPLPRRVRQASLVDELRLDPGAQNDAAQPPRWQDDPMLRPVPRRAGATIGAFQRRSRAARANAEPPAPAPGTPGHPTRDEDGS
ncbi:nitrate- and nitrite sensing domain-containing protein [Streptomyces sp. SAT1]|uniref:nitrate- and nitrite sensing domain-containing protein n=1 Tax=Streptomyces sp. SAT1 TaxID=1849967 RepID=UPI000AF3A328|nr:nitrate- and nitrite sensing domain-containing protein [Streptomyces sp. SAT1]